MSNTLFTFFVEWGGLYAIPFFAVGLALRPKFQEKHPTLSESLSSLWLYIPLYICLLMLIDFSLDHDLYAWPTFENLATLGFRPLCLWALLLFIPFPNHRQFKKQTLKHILFIILSAFLFSCEFTGPFCSMCVTDARHYKKANPKSPCDFCQHNHKGTDPNYCPLFAEDPTWHDSVVERTPPSKEEGELATLTDSERRALFLWARTYTPTGIARMLQISREEALEHLYTIRKKLGTTSRKHIFAQLMTKIGP